MVAPLIVGFVIALVVSFFVGKMVMRFIAAPVEEQLQRYWDNYYEKKSREIAQAIKTIINTRVIRIAPINRAVGIVSGGSSVTRLTTATRSLSFAGNAVAVPIRDTVSRSGSRDRVVPVNAAHVLRLGGHAGVLASGQQKSDRTHHGESSEAEK